MRKLSKFFVTGLVASLLSSVVWAAPQAKIQTSMGDIVVELNAEKAPATVENFIRYAKDKFYDGTIFHRVINNFMIQGGGFNEKMSEKATKYSPIKNEAANGLKNDRGTIAMARTQDPHSASAQFYINVADNAPLNHRSPDINGYGYAVFGKVISGMDVVDKIKEVQTGNKGPHQNVPVKPIIIKSITIIGEIADKDVKTPEKATAPAKPAQ